MAAEAVAAVAAQQVPQLPPPSAVAKPSEFSTLCPGVAWARNAATAATKTNAAIILFTVVSCGRSASGAAATIVRRGKAE